MKVHKEIDRPVTYQDVLDAPEGRVAEIVNGVFYLQAQPAPPHNSVEKGLTSFLVAAFEQGRGGPGGWWIVPEPELQFRDRDYRTLVPDMAGWRKERLPEFPRRWSDLTIPPDWVCEILSPSTARLDRVEKMPVYAEEGVRHLWLADPLAKTLEVFELTGGRWTLIAAHGGDGDAAIAPFDAVPLPLGDLWLPEPEEDADAG
jgi:Uma2 family endonuclease